MFCENQKLQIMDNSGTGEKFNYNVSKAENCIVSLNISPKAFIF